MRRTRLGGAAAVIFFFIVFTVAVPPAARAQSPTGSPAAPGRRPPVLERFTATFETTTGATRYVAVARDPDGGKVAYRWNLKATCGALGNRNGTGPTNTYEHGPAVRGPDGCPGDAERAATLTLAIADSTGCAVEYTQPARDEKEHVRPKTRALGCASAAAAGKGGGFPFARVLLLLGALLVVLAVVRWVRARPQRPADIAPRPRRTKPAPAAGGPARHDDSEWEPASEPEFEPFQGCLEGSVRNEATEVVAHESVLAGPVVIVASGEAGTWRVELAEDTEATRAELTSSLGIVPGRVLEIRADVTVRALTAICERREVCRAGRWARDVATRTKEGPERVEVLRAKASAPEDFDRFADEVLAPRIVSLRRGRRRVDAALERSKADSPATGD